MSVQARILFFVVLFSTAMNCCAQSQANTIPIISSEQLKQDFVIFKDSIEKLHAGLYRYREKTDLDRLFDSSYATLSKNMEINEFYLLLRNLVSNIQDGHTSCNLPRELGKRYIDSIKMFPIHLWFISDRAYIPCSTKHVLLTPETEVIAIDNKPVSEIRNKLFSYLSSDGSNQTKKFWDLNNEGFIPLYFLAYGDKSSFEISYKAGNGKTATMGLQADYFKKSECGTTPVVNPKYLKLDFRPNKIAVLTIKTFVGTMFKDQTEFPRFLEASFKEIRNKKIEKLIIDLRDNDGGDDVYGSMLYSYLTDKTFEYYTSLESTTKKFHKEDHPNLSIQEPARYNFNGKVFFLINGNSFSTTAEFCSIAKSNKRGVFIGEETGGGYYGNTSGGWARIILPNSKIAVGIPRIKYSMAVKEAVHKDRGIIPDFPIVPGIKDIVRKRDVQMHYALRLAGG
jgi:hypothetical protein